MTTATATALRVSVLQDALKAALALPARVAATRAVLPAVTQVLLRTEDGRLTLSATDLERACVTHANAKVDGDGAALVPARLLAQLIDRLPERERVDLSVEGNTLHIRCGRVHAQLRTMGPNEFPPIPTAGDDATEIRLRADVLRSAISRVVMAAAADGTRPVLQAVYFEAAAGVLTLAAADGYRLAVQRVAVPDVAGSDGQWLVPAKHLPDVLRLTDDDELVTMAFSARVAVFTTAAGVLTMQLIPGKFPDFRQLIPQAHSTRTVMDVATLLDALRVVTLIGQGGAGITRIIGEVDPATGVGAVTLSANGGEELDNGVASLDAVIEGEPSWRWAGNARYLTDVLAVLGDGNLTFDTNDQNSPGVFRLVGDDAYLHVIMPMFIGTW